MLTLYEVCMVALLVPRGECLAVRGHVPGMTGCVSLVLKYSQVGMRSQETDNITLEASNGGSLSAAVSRWRGEQAVGEQRQPTRLFVPNVGSHSTNVPRSQIERSSLGTGVTGLHIELDGRPRSRGPMWYSVRGRPAVTRPMCRYYGTTYWREWCHHPGYASSRHAVRRQETCRRSRKGIHMLRNCCGVSLWRPAAPSYMLRMCVWQTLVALRAS